MEEIAKQSKSNNLRRGNPAWGSKKDGTGKSGNPDGKIPNHVYITSLIKEYLGKDAGDGKSHAQLVAEAIVKLAEDYHFKGNVAAIRELLDRIEGKVTQPVSGEGTVTLIVKYDGENDAVQE